MKRERRERERKREKGREKGRERKEERAHVSVDMEICNIKTALDVAS